MTALAIAGKPARARVPGTPVRMLLRERGMGASVVVAAVSAAFGTILLTTTGFLDALLRADPYIGDSGTLAFVLGFLGVLLLAVAVYVAAIVTANTFATVVAGRTRRIALLRLIGASARAQRAEVARQGLVVGAIGAVLGLAVGSALAAVAVAVAPRLLGIADPGYAVLQPTLVVPAVVVALTTWAAAWSGSRRVLSVTPLAALGGSQEATTTEIAARTGRHAVALVFVGLGVLLLAAGIAAGAVTPLAVVVAFAGGVLSFTGLVVASALVLPPALRAVGAAFGGSAMARLAARNALRHPERSSRMAVGVTMGVTLITMFAVAAESAKAVLAASAGGSLDPELAAVLDTFAAVMMGLVAVSAVIASVGLVNLVTLGIIQRRRELGLLRTLGLSNSQVRRLVLLEAAHLTVTALVCGLLLGTVYGWAGAQSLLGSIPLDPDAASSFTFVLPAVPPGPVVVVVAATALLTLVCAVVPTRLTTRVSPVAALAD